MPPKSKKKKTTAPKRKVRGGWRSGQPLPKTKYEEVWRLYSKGESRAAMARALKLSEPTIAKCIDHGYPQRGMEPLKERLHRVRRQAMDLADRQATHTRAKIYRQAQGQLANAMAISILMTNALDDYRQRTTERSPDGRAVFKNPGTHPKEEPWNPQMVGKLLDNFAKSTSAVNQWREIFEAMAPWAGGEEDKEFAGWSTEELEHFAETGDLPERLVQEFIMEEPI